MGAILKLTRRVGKLQSQLSEPRNHQVEDIYHPNILEPHEEQRLVEEDAKVSHFDKHGSHPDLFELAEDQDVVEEDTKVPYFDEHDGCDQSRQSLNLAQELGQV